MSTDTGQTDTTLRYHLLGVLCWLCTLCYIPQNFNILSFRRLDSSTSAKIMVRQLQERSDFDAALQDAGSKLLVVDFTATWCGPCKMIGPRFEAMSTSGEFPHVIFVKVDVDENQETAALCGVRAMPTFQFFRHGHKIAEFGGADEAKLRMLLKAHGGPPVSLSPSSPVAAFGLQSRPELNGQRGTVSGYDPTKERYQFVQPDGVVGLKRGNLVQLLKVQLKPTPSQPLPEGLDGVSEASITGYDPDAESYSAEAAGRQLAPLPLAVVVLPCGTVGVVTGLQGAPQHNGKSGHLLEWDAEADRYLVALDNEKQLKLKRANFRA